MKTESELPVADEEVGHFEIEPIFGSALPEVAAFLHRWRSEKAVAVSRHSTPARALESAVGIERRLRWQLVENPVAKEGFPLGYCVRDRAGVIRGINLCFPSAFLAGEQRLLGLCSGSFFVESPARSMGFYLFKKYLSVPGYSFYFATTCNANSEPLWRLLGARVVPHSEIEYVVPLRLDRMFPAFAASRTSNQIAAEIARLAGRCANPILRSFTRFSASLTIEPCQDWEKLSDLFHRHRSADRITSDRSVEFLQWRYGPASPAHPCSIYLFRDKKGNEGWFSLGDLVRGGIRGPFLLDAIWPQERMDFRGIFDAIVRIALSRSDAVFFRRRPGINYRELCRWAIPHNLEARTFVMSSQDAPMALDELDYDDNDYLAWMFHGTSTENVSGSVQLVKAG